MVKSVLRKVRGLRCETKTEQSQRSKGLWDVIGLPKRGRLDLIVGLLRLVENARDLERRRSFPQISPVMVANGQQLATTAKDG